MLIATVESLTGTQIDHYAEINLAGFVELTDALGGVPVCLNKPVHDDTYSGLNLPAGYRTVTGPMALAFGASGTAGGRRPRSDRAPAGVHRRTGATAAERGRTHQPGHAPAAAR